MDQVWSLWRRYKWVVLFFSILAGCASSRSSKNISEIEEKVHQVEIYKKIAATLESNLKKVKDRKVSQYLSNISRNILEKNPDLNQSKIHIVLIANKSGGWTSYALPENRIYIPSSLIKEIQYENEIAAIIAVQLGHLMNQSLVHRLKELNLESKLFQSSERNILYHQLNSIDEVKKIFKFSFEAEVSAFRTGVNILYRAGYDPRGFVSICNLYLKNPDYFSYSSDKVSELMENVRQEIAIYPPLRNPIVKSQNFILIQKRIQQL